MTDSGSAGQGFCSRISERTDGGPADVGGELHCNFMHFFFLPRLYIVLS